MYKLTYLFDTFLFRSLRYGFFLLLSCVCSILAKYIVLSLLLEITPASLLCNNIQYNTSCMGCISSKGTLYSRTIDLQQRKDRPYLLLESSVQEKRKMIASATNSTKARQQTKLQLMGQYRFLIISEDRYQSSEQIRS